MTREEMELAYKANSQNPLDRKAIVDELREKAGLTMTQIVKMLPEERITAIVQYREKQRAAKEERKKRATKTDQVDTMLDRIFDGLLR